VRTDRDLSIVVPAYNEVDRLPRALAELLAHLREWPGSFEIVLVDDGSSDGTAALAEELLGPVPAGRVVRLDRNRGKGAAVRAGVLQTDGARVVFMDADMATDLAFLDVVVRALADADVALGSRSVHGSRIQDLSPVGAAAHRLFAGLARVMTGVPVRDFQCGFKAFRGDAARRLFADVVEPGYAFDVEVLLRAHQAGLRIVEVPVHWRVVEGSHVRRLRDSATMAAQLVRITRRLGRA
jgi:glycosyltransferase involved in cell wall biosynthesis